MLEARDITFGYTAGKLLLHHVTFGIASEERVYLEGPSGAGKTTLCRLLAGYALPQEGVITVDGTTLPRRGRCPVQLIGQHPEYVLDPRMRMEASLGEAGEPEEALLEALGIRNAWMRRYPHELSGGELQRFCIARALTSHPRYLIADEMTTMLDAITQRHIWEVVLSYCSRTHAGLLFTTHSPALAKCLATRTLPLASLGLS